MRTIYSYTTDGVEGVSGAWQAQSNVEKLIMPSRDNHHVILHADVLIV